MKIFFFFLIRWIIKWWITNSCREALFILCLDREAMFFWHFQGVFNMRLRWIQKGRPPPSGILCRFASRNGTLGRENYKSRERSGGERGRIFSIWADGNLRLLHIGTWARGSSDGGGVVAPRALSATAWLSVLPPPLYDARPPTKVYLTPVPVYAVVVRNKRARAPTLAFENWSSFPLFFFKLILLPT